MVGFDINKNYAIYYGKNNFSQKCDYYVESKTKKHGHVVILNSTVYIHHLLCSKSIEQQLPDRITSALNKNAIPITFFLSTRIF